MGRDSAAAVAGTTRMDFLTDYFHVTDVINMKTFFEMAAQQVTDDLSAADVIVTNHDLAAPEGAEIIREYDYEKILAMM